VSHLRCPHCRLTVPAAAYYLRGDQCPRCMTGMEPYTRPRPGAAGTVVPPPATAPHFAGESPQPGT
jgi:hypothetical protein